MTDIDNGAQMATMNNILKSVVIGEFSGFDNLTFQTPWSARVFGITLAASESGAFAMREFQQALIESIRAHELEHGCIDGDLAYYSCWTEALAQLLQKKRIINSGDLASDEDRIREALQALQHEHDHDDVASFPAPVYVEEGR